MSAAVRQRMLGMIGERVRIVYTSRAHVWRGSRIPVWGGNGSSDCLVSARCTARVEAVERDYAIVVLEDMQRRVAIHLASVVEVGRVLITRLS